MAIAKLGPACLALLAATPALAQEMPRYDVEGHCAEVSRMGGGSDMIRNGCIEIEQDAYNALKDAWPGLPERTRGYCAEIGAIGGGSYSILEGCVQMETDAAGNRPVFRW